VQGVPATRALQGTLRLPNYWATHILRIGWRPNSSNIAWRPTKLIWGSIVAFIAATGPTLPFTDVVAAIADVISLERTGEPVPGTSDDQAVGVDHDVAAQTGTADASALEPVLGQADQEPSPVDATSTGLDHAESTGGSVSDGSNDQNALAAQFPFLGQGHQRQGFGDLFGFDLGPHTGLDSQIYPVPDFGGGPLVGNNPLEGRAGGLSPGAPLPSLLAITPQSGEAPPFASARPRIQVGPESWTAPLAGAPFGFYVDPSKSGGVGPVTDIAPSTDLYPITGPSDIDGLTLPIAQGFEPTREPISVPEPMTPLLVGIAMLCLVLGRRNQSA